MRMNTNDLSEALDEAARAELRERMKSAPSFALRVGCRLAADIRRAKELAVKAVPDNCEDGGSANWDRPGIYVTCRLTKGVREAVEKACAAAGVELSWSSRPKAFLLSVPPETDGMGARRTLAAEAMVESLRADGWDAWVRYLTD